jgi:hypothetical protein
MAEPKNVMDVASMKVLLVKSKEDPVSSTFGLGGDGGAKLLLHKTKGPQALGRQLEADCPDLKNMRFGKALVDVDDDPKLVKLTVNRAVSGMCRRLVRTLKGTGFTKVIILLEDGTVVEKHDAEEEAEAAETETSEATETTGTVPPPPPPPPAAAAPSRAAPDAASLAQRLRNLIEQVGGAIAAAPDRKDTLLALAGAAQASLKSGDLAGADARLAALATALGLGAPPKAAPAMGTGVAFQKLRLLWDGTRKYLMDQLKSLEAAIVAQSVEDPDAEAIAANVTKLEVSLQTLDTKLSDALDDLYNAGGSDPALKQAARRIAAGYQAFLAADPLMQELDGNPFVKLDARVRLEATLTAVMGHL